ncbi:MAG: hypothetical protein ACMG6H_03425 [Acidobacteriota bacterium]
MKYRYTLTLLVFASAAIVCGVAAQSNKSTSVRKEVSLKFGGKEITAVELENTHSRSYTDSSIRQRCDADKKTEGVIWVIVCEGKAITKGDISFEDENGLKFQHVCWSRKTQGIYSRRGGDETEFLTVGPGDSKKVKITFGDASAEIEMPK